ncbi:MAG TPA: hypothetical protein DCS37_00405 [Clostridiales bacterium]|nr:hypothetical protein [Clostridiales bacterium]
MISLVSIISKLRLGYEYLNLPYVIPSVSVGIKAKPHFATLDCHVATSLLLAMTNGKIFQYSATAAEPQFHLRKAQISLCRRHNFTAP